MKEEASVQRESVSIRPAGGVALEVRARHHLLTVDQPKEEGGDDQGITPVEMFVSSLGACIGYFAVRFLRRHNLSTEGFNVTVEWDYAEQPHRVGAIRAHVDLPKGFPAEMKERLQKVMEGCTIHHSLTHSPQIGIELKETA